MIHRMVAAVLALVGVLLSLYLWLWKIGVLGTMVCGTGACERVQTSSYATVAGVPVAFVGLLGYVGLLGVALLGLQPKWAERRDPTVWLAILSGVGVGFTAYLSYIEAFVLNAWCRWCLGSAGIIAAIFLTSLMGLWRIGGSADRRIVTPSQTEPPNRRTAGPPN